jgi:hypothetical protein
MGNPHVDYSAYDATTREVHAHLVDAIAARPPSSAPANVRGVGLGERLTVYVESPTPEADVREALVSELGVDEAQLAGLRLDVVVIGTVETTAPRIRPAPGGSSVSNVRGSGGTFGCLVTGLSGPWRGVPQILGNNHVLARANEGAVGDPVVQPAIDSGGTPGDEIATLAQWVPLWFEGSERKNYMDAATAAAEPLVTPQVLGIPGVSSDTVLAYVGQPVQKSGAVSGLRTATVLAIGVTVWVDCAPGGPAPRWALFADVIVSGEADLVFQAAGDSGAVLWTTETPARAVGLTFAGGAYGDVRYCAYAGAIGGTLDALNLAIVPYDAL